MGASGRSGLEHMRLEERLSMGFAQPREEKVKGRPYGSLQLADGWGERTEPGSSRR